jgi:hypothetical protein
MNRTHVTVLLALSVLLLPVSNSYAQRIFAPQQGQDISRPGRAIEGDAQMCQGAAGGSRVRANCDGEGEPTPVLLQAAKAPIPKSALTVGPSCEATTLTEYIQRNTVARVGGTVAVKNCPVGSTGSYDIVIRVKDATGTIKPLEFSEQWQDHGAEGVKFSAEYPIGEDTELVNVRVRNLRCTCGDSGPTSEGAGAASAGENSTERGQDE